MRLQNNLKFVFCTGQSSPHSTQLPSIPSSLSTRLQPSTLSILTSIFFFLFSFLNLKKKEWVGGPKSLFLSFLDFTQQGCNHSWSSAHCATCKHDLVIFPFHKGDVMLHHYVIRGKDWKNQVKCFLKLGIKLMTGCVSRGYQK